ncbi:MAG: retropepsin-like aspartic protease family protein [Planktomarina sp.]
MGDSIASLIYVSILLVSVASIFFASNRPSLGKSLQMLLAWGMIFMGMIAIYGLWGDISKNFTRNIAQTSDENTITTPRRSDGHFYLTLDVNGVPVEFMVDTGASDMVLTQADAARAKVDMEGLAYLGRANTANGQVKIARTRLDEVRLGPYVDRRVSASVNGGDMFGSLLGMSYLSRFDRMEMTADHLILHR